jgi:hypothetical protein
MTLVVFFNLILGASCVFAIARGGGPERLAALLFGAAGIATFLIPAEYWTGFRSIDVPLLAIDIALLGSLVVLSARADRFWPIWVAAVQLVIVLVHVAMAYNPAIVPLIYFAVSSRLAYVMIAMLVIATVRHQRRVARFGIDASWSRSRQAVPREGNG